MTSPVAVVKVRVEAVSLCSRSKPTAVLTITRYVVLDNTSETSTLFSEVVMLWNWDSVGDRETIMTVYEMTSKEHCGWVHGFHVITSLSSSSNDQDTLEGGWGYSV